MQNFNKETDAIQGIQAWLQAQCNGDREHTYGIKIETLDNPGWWVTIDFEETEWENLVLPLTQEERSEFDWIEIVVRNHKFIGSGGVGNLNEILRRFLTIVGPRP